MASAVFRRAFATFSTKKSLQQEIKVVTSDLRKDGYPKRFILRMLEKSRHPPLGRSSPPSHRVRVSYISRTSHALSRVLGRYGIAVTHKPVSTIGHRLPLPKDRSPKKRPKAWSTAYHAKDCPASYIGESKNYAERLTRHKYDVRKKDVEASPLAEHAEAAGHTVDFERSTVLVLERNRRKQLSSLGSSNAQRGM